MLSQYANNAFVGKQRQDGAVVEKSLRSCTRQFTFMLEKLGVEVNIISTMYEDHHDHKKILNSIVKQKRKNKSFAGKRRKLSLSGLKSLLHKLELM